MWSGGSWGFFSTKFSSKRRSCFHVSHPPCNYLHTSARQAACFTKCALPLGELCGALPAFGASSGFLYCFTNRAHKGGLEGEKTRRCRAGVPVWTSGLGEGSWGEKGAKHQGFFFFLFLFFFLVSRRFVLFPDKYSSQFGGGSQYAYFHEEDETSFQLVDTARTQKTAYQRNRMRFAQVTCSQRQGRRAASAAQDSFPTEMSFFFFSFPSFLQRNLRRDKDRRNMLQFSMQTLPKSAKQKER